MCWFCLWFNFWKIKIWTFELSQTELVVFINRLKISQVEKNELFKLITEFTEETANYYAEEFLKHKWVVK